MQEDECGEVLEGDDGWFAKNKMILINHLVL